MKKIFEKWTKTTCISLINYKESWANNGVGKCYDIFTNKARLIDKWFSFSINFQYYNFNFSIHDMNNNILIKFLRKCFLHE